MHSIFTEKYKTAANKLILLDYDGTLVDFDPMPERAKPSAQLLEILMTLADNHQTKVVIISGRRQYEIDSFLGDLPVNIIAEHGAMIKENGRWRKLVIENELWKQSVLPIFERFTLSCSNSFVEEKQYSLTWHYRNVQTELGYEYSRDLIRALWDSVRSYNLRIIDGNKIVELMNNEINKGKAVNKVFLLNNYDYVLSIGDDQTDEDMFRALLDNLNAYTIKVGEGKTVAKHKLKSVSEVLNLLSQLTK